jgi:hypothetical protein
MNLFVKDDDREQALRGWRLEVGGPWLNSLRLSSSKNLTGQAGIGGRRPEVRSRTLEILVAKRHTTSLFGLSFILGKRPYDVDLTSVITFFITHIRPHTIPFSNR